MTQASPTRIESRLAKKKNQPEAQHQTISFAQAMADSQIKAVEARITPYLDRKMAQLAQEIFMSVYRVVVKDKEFMQIRQMALESVLKDKVPGFNDEILADAIAKVEDDILGLTEVPADEGIKAGDNVRLEVSQAKAGSEDFGEKQKVVISSILQKNKEGKVQTLEELETNIVGLKKGEEKTFLIPAIDDKGEPENDQMKVSIKKVSRKKEQPKNEQTPNP